MSADSDRDPLPLKAARDSSRHWRRLAWSAAGSVLIASLLPVPDLAQAPRDSDKLVHVVMYATLMFCFSRAYSPSAWPRIAVALISYGAGIEILQHLLPWRSASLADTFANLAGVSIMLIGLCGRPRIRTAGD